MTILSGKCVLSWTCIFVVCKWVTVQYEYILLLSDCIIFSLLFALCILLLFVLINFFSSFVLFVFLFCTFCSLFSVFSVLYCFVYCFFLGR